MPRFLPKPSYTIGEFVQILNAFEQTRPADRHGQRPIWNRWKVRRLLHKFGVLPRGNGERSKGIIFFTNLREMAPELVDSMMLIDAHEDAQAA